MKTEFTVTRLIDYNHFFGEPNDGCENEYAQRIGIENICNYCILLLSCTKAGKIPNVNEFLQRIFITETTNYANSPSYKYLKDKYNWLIYKNQGTIFEIHSNESLLYMYMWADKNREMVSNDIKLEDVQPIDILKLYLLFNYKTNIKSDRYSLEPKNRLDYNRLLLSDSFSQSDLININYWQLILTQIYKTASLLTFMYNEAEYNELLKKWLIITKIKSINFYLNTMFDTLKLIIKMDDEYNTIDFQGADNRLEISCVLNYLASTNNLYDAEQDDFKDLRNSPFFKVSDWKYKVVFDLFFIKKIYNGLIFHFSTLDSQLPKFEKTDFYSKIKKDFSEEHLLHNVLKYILNDTDYKKFEGEKLDKLGGIDYYAFASDKILLFESKDFFMRGEYKQSYNFDIIEEHLKYDSKGKPDRLFKGVKQLVTNIERLILKEKSKGYSNEYRDFTDYSEKEVKFYPIIVVHDALYSCAGLNFIVNDWFNNELVCLQNDDRFSGYDFTNIMPLTIVEIDTLILYKQNFKSREIDLIKLIDDYHNDAKYNLDDEKYNGQEVVSFSHYINNYCIMKNIVIDLAEYPKIVDETQNLV